MHLAQTLLVVLVLRVHTEEENTPGFDADSLNVLSEWFILMTALKYIEVWWKKCLCCDKIQKLIWVLWREVVSPPRRVC